MNAVSTLIIGILSLAGTMTIQPKMVFEIKKAILVKISKGLPPLSPMTQRMTGYKDVP